jgi:hypothetical protein
MRLHRGLILKVEEVRAVELQRATEFADFKHGITAS